MTAGRVKVRWRCNKCRKEGVAEVRARRRGEDIAYWMKRIVGRDVNAAHQTASFLCECDKVDLILPMERKDDPDYWIGKENDVEPIGFDEGKFRPIE